MVCCTLFPTDENFFSVHYFLIVSRNRATTSWPSTLEDKQPDGYTSRFIKLFEEPTPRRDDGRRDKRILWDPNLNCDSTNLISVQYRWFVGYTLSLWLHLAHFMLSEIFLINRAPSIQYLFVWQLGDNVEKHSTSSPYCFTMKTSQAFPELYNFVANHNIMKTPPCSSQVHNVLIKIKTIRGVHIPSFLPVHGKMSNYATWGMFWVFD